MRISCRINGLEAMARGSRGGVRRWVTIGVCLLVAISAWMVLGSRNGGSDEMNYRRAVRNMRLPGKLQNVCRWLPHALARPLDHELRRPFHAYDELETRLLASGFLTNISIVITGAPTLLSSNLKGTLDEINSRLHKAVPGSDFLPFSLERDFQKTQVTVRINYPTRDVSALQKALENH